MATLQFHLNTQKLKPRQMIQDLNLGCIVFNKLGIVRLVVKFTIMILAPQLIFDLTPAELISSNLLYSIEGQKYGMLCHYQLRLPLVCPPSKESFLISSVNCMKRPTLLKSQYNVSTGLKVLTYLRGDLSV